jgi:hypothetical protein
VFVLRYDFEVRACPAGEIWLAIEQPERYRIWINEQAADPDRASGWWCDRSLKRVPIHPGVLKQGRNTVRIEGVYGQGHPGLEPIYLLGAFGVRLEGTKTILEVLPAALSLGDWGPQGLPFFAGSVTYRTTATLDWDAGQRVILRVPSYRGTAVRVHVEGSMAGVLAWEPLELDLTALLRKARPNDIGIEVIAHRRNSHGPLHCSAKRLRFTGPDTFRPSADQWSDAYRLVACGLMDAPTLVVQA